MSASDLRGADIVLASPPCTCFSFAAQAKYWPHLGERHPLVDDALRLIKHTLSIMREADTRYWVLENPFNRLRQFIGAPAAKTAWCAWGTRYKKPTYLWGKLPPIDWRVPHKWDGDSRGGAGNGAIGSPYPPDPAVVALVPYEFSLALCLAAEGNSAQQTLLAYGRDSSR